MGNIYTNYFSGTRISDDWQAHRSRGSLGGVDYAVGVGTPIKAPTDGVVSNIANNGTGGHTVNLTSANGWKTQFMHCSRFVNAGNYKQGDVIGYTGGAAGSAGAGSSTGPHCHTHLIKPNGQRVNALDYVGKDFSGGEPFTPKPIVKDKKMNFREWLDSRNGVGVNVDGQWGAQCWDLWSDYAMTLFGASMYQTSTDSGGNVHVSGYACGIWHGFGGNLNWAFTPVGPDQPAQYGDVAIWEYGSGVGPQSHVALVVEDRGGAVYCLTQNPGAAHYDNLSKSGLLGYLRPDNQAIIGGGGAPASSGATPSGSIADLASAVIRGDYGNGPAREAALGSLYAEVQAEVNRRLNGGGSAPAPAPVSNAAEVQPGDGYWHVAERVWGGDEATINANMNKLIDINGGVRLYAGMILQTEYPAAPVVDNSAAEAAAKAQANAEAAAKAVAEAEAASKLAEEAAAKAKAEAEQAAKDEETRLANIAAVKKTEAAKAEEAKKTAVQDVAEAITETVNNTIENITEGVTNMITAKYHGPALNAEQYQAIQTEVAAADNAGIDEVKNYNLVSKEFWNYAGERVIKTFAMATAGQLSVTAAYVVTSPDSAVVFADLGWTYIVSVAGVSALTSLLTALANFKDIITLKKNNNHNCILSPAAIGTIKVFPPVAYPGVPPCDEGTVTTVLVPGTVSPLNLT